MKKIAVLIFVLLTGIGGLFLYTKLKGTEKQQVKVFKTEKVKRGEIKNIINATAIVKTQVNAYLKIGTRTTGLVQKMFIDIGDYVKKGQLIAIIDQREFKKNIEKTEYQIERAKNKLEQINKVYPARIREAEKNLEVARAEYEYALWKFKREKELLKEEFTTEESFEIARRELETKKARMKLAQETLKKLKLEYETEKKIAEDDIKVLQKELERQKVRLSYTEIYSPIDGIVSNIVAREGETLVAGLQAAELVTILKPDKLEIQIFVDETDIGKIKPGQKVEYHVDAFPDKIFTGKITKIYPEPIVKQNIVYYLAIVPVRKEYALYLRPEMTVYTKIIAGVKKNAIIVPNSAIRFEKGKQYVYVIKNGKPVIRYIKTGWIDENYTEVVEGLKEGELIAVKFSAPVKTKVFK
ncbi:HlyD family secretion protein/membrane fusion protein, macrolide-specific efflux system [Persephonella hydrogeniphila]|uniref:HlyD family secretion protein/membrane fusion protein, macrolide-specific efflux system n=1 Tax=Persephonella hydrogeniphila TaxID=198703 RepID=A0A285N010_9AQUI|nr:efflux RND transporter periplasmic adaptor subunit [Persephonella hydrogeniphila]SNZ02769.1 HlyD family secretion protein/membrane fusion protein, macrolide-specific efflux system [Persephonella hydrogeniphila]